MWILHTESKKEQGIEILRLYVKQKKRITISDLKKEKFIIKSNIYTGREDQFNKIYNVLF